MPTAYYAPGVYIEEVDKGTKPIQGVATSVTAFIGFTQRAEKFNDDELTTRSILGEPTLVTNWTQYQRYFGSYHEDAYLPYSVRGFFDNGGARCYVISIRAMESHKAQKVITAQEGKKAVPSLLVIAKNSGLAGNDIQIKVDKASGGAKDSRDATKLLKLSVQVNGQETQLRNSAQQLNAKNMAIEAMRKELVEKEKEWAALNPEARKKALADDEKALNAEQQKWQDEKAKWDALEKEVKDKGINLGASGEEWEQEKAKWTNKQTSLDDVRKQARAAKKDWEKLKESWEEKKAKLETSKKDLESGKVDLASLKAEWQASWQKETSDWAFALDDLPLWDERNRKNIQALANEQSDHVQVWRVKKGGRDPQPLPEPSTLTLEGGALQFDHLFLQEQNLLEETDIVAAGQDATTEALLFDKKSTELYRGDEAKRKGIDGLFAIDDINLVCAPDLMKIYDSMSEDKTAADNIVKGVQSTLLTFCANAHYPFAILDAPPKRDVQGIAEWRMSLPGADTMYGALYYPWIKIADPFNGGRQIEIPPCGHIAGIYARSDSERGVHKAPANEPVNGALDLQLNVSKREQELLNPMGVNCIRSFPGRGIRVWGARTLALTDPSWRYINVRRLFSYVEASIERSTQWIVFEPNDQILWAKVRRDITAFLRTVWLSGALFGTTPEQAFYVKCDAETNPPELRDLGQMVCEIGMAPVKPAEFVIFRFSQWADQVEG